METPEIVTPPYDPGLTVEEILALVDLLWFGSQECRLPPS